MNSKKPNLLLTLLLCIAGMVLLFLPAEKTDRVRLNVRDVLRPGQVLLQSTVAYSGRAFASLKTVPDQSQEIATLKAELFAQKTQNQRLMILNSLQKTEITELKTTGSTSFPVTESQPLLVPEITEAVVLGAETASLLRSGKLLDKGSANGVRESELVLESDDRLIDQGIDAGLKTGQPVYAGQNVVGRIANVGRFSSTLQEVTHPEYRGRARLAQKTDGKIIFGAAGILTGQGKPVCKLERVSSTVPVSVGDEVYTDHRDGLFSAPMYYGRVTKAELKPGSPRWEIEVQPATADANLKRVQILRKRINPVRLAGHETDAVPTNN